MLNKPILFLLAAAALPFSACDTEPSPEVAYLIVDGLQLNTTAEQGMPTSKFTTLWVEQNGQQLGAFSPPCTIPVLSGNDQKFRFIPGIQLNGYSNLYNQYEVCEPLSTTRNLSPDQTLDLGSLTFNYRPNYAIEVVEDFDGVGLQFAATQGSDTNLLRTSDPNEMLVVSGMSNSKSGTYTLQPMTKGEFKSISAFELPKGGANVWLEVDYKTEVALTFGIYSNEPTQSLQTPVVTLFPSEEWNKVYLNLVTEVSGHPQAVNYNLFFGSLNTTDSTVQVWIDNLKLLY